MPCLILKLLRADCLDFMTPWVKYNTCLVCYIYNNKKPQLLKCMNGKIGLPKNRFCLPPLACRALGAVHKRRWHFSGFLTSHSPKSANFDQFLTSSPSELATSFLDGPINSLRRWSRRVISFKWNLNLQHYCRTPAAPPSTHRSYYQIVMDRLWFFKSRTSVIDFE